MSRRVTSRPRRLALEPLEQRQLLAVVAGVVSKATVVTTPAPAVVKPVTTVTSVTTVPLTSVAAKPVTTVTSASTTTASSSGHSLAQPATIALYSDGSGTQTGKIATKGQVDVYRITATVTGTMTIHQVAAQGSPLDSMVSAYNSSQALLAQNDDDGTSLNSCVNISVTAGSTYYVEAAAFNAGATGGSTGAIYNTTGAYVLSFSTARTPPNTFTTAQTITLNGTGGGSQAGQLNYVGDYDYFKFVAPVSGLMTIQQLAAAGSSIDSYLYVYGGNQKLLWFNDDHNNSLNSYVQTNVAAGATYYVKAAATHSTFGAYTLTFSTVPNTGDDYPNTFAQAWPLVLQANGSGSQNGKIDYSGDVDMFKITAPASGNMTFREEATATSSLDAYLTVYDANGNVLAANDDDPAGGTTDSRVDVTVTAGATYYIGAAGVGNSLGAYGLYLDMGETPPTPVLLGPQNYAVLWCGADNATDNYASYYNNIKALYQTLTATQSATQVGYDVPAQNIYLLYADGSSVALDQTTNSGLSTSDMTFAAGSDVLSATPANLQYVLAKVGLNATSQDHFFFDAYGEGGGSLSSTSSSIGPATAANDAYLVGWGSNLQVAGDQLAPWLQGVHAGTTTYVFNESYGGGMLQDLENGAGALPANTFGCADTNHYEVAVDPSDTQAGFAGNVVAALQAGYRTTQDLFNYSEANDGALATAAYTANAGTAVTGQEHPWSLGADFRVFYTATNAAPTLTTITPLLGAPLAPASFPFSYFDLAENANAADADLDQVDYRIDAVTSGTLTINGAAVVPGTTIVHYNDNLVWTPPAAATGTVAAFTVEAWDGLAFSGTPVQVSVSLGTPLFLGLKDPVLANLVKSLDADGSISRADMIKILQATVATKPTLTAVDFNDLKTILKDATETSPVLVMPGYVQVLASDVILGNVANATWTGGLNTTQTLGNAAAGMAKAKFEELIGKWFLGTDLPSPQWWDFNDPSLADDGGTYLNVSGSLYGASGAPSYLDLNQGEAGDCYYISSLGAIANTNPAAIENMFIDNGDGTWTVRFYNNGQPDYVTVNSELPGIPPGQTSAVGGPLWFDGITLITNANSPSNVLWVTLAEKAYAQWNEVGDENHGMGSDGNSDDGVNSYLRIGDGGWADATCTQVLGTTAQGYFTLVGNEQTLVTAIQTAKTAVTVGTTGLSDTLQTLPDGLYDDHEYVVLGVTVNAADPTKDTFTLYNPWGPNQPGYPAFQPTPVSWTDMLVACDYFSVANDATTVQITAANQVVKSAGTATPHHGRGFRDAASASANDGGAAAATTAAAPSAVSAVTPAAVVARPDGVAHWTTAPAAYAGDLVFAHSSRITGTGTLAATDLDATRSLAGDDSASTTQQPSREKLVDLVLLTHPDWGYTG